MTTRASALGAERPKNPLLLPSVAAAPFSSAHLLPAAPPQPHRTDSFAQTHSNNREPKAIPLSLNSSSNVPNEEKLDRVSNVKLDDEDDFDIESYYARLHAIPSLDSSSEIKRKESIVEESSFSEIDLNSPIATESDLVDQNGLGQSQSIASDLAQNLSQLPQVLPQMASTVLSSFSSMLSLGRGTVRSDQAEVSEAINACPPPCYSPPNSDESDNVIIPLFNKDEFSNNSKSIQSRGNVEESAENDFRKKVASIPNVDGQYVPQNTGDKSSGLGPSNMFRMSSQKKKMYAQVPGLTLGDDGSIAKDVSTVPESFKFPQNSISANYPYSCDVDDKLRIVNSQMLNQESNSVCINHNLSLIPNETLYYNPNNDSATQRSPFTDYGINNSSQVNTISIDSNNFFTGNNVMNASMPEKTIIDDGKFFPRPNEMENKTFENIEIMLPTNTSFLSNSSATSILPKIESNIMSFNNFNDFTSNQEENVFEDKISVVENISQDINVSTSNEDFVNHSQFKQSEHGDHVQHLNVVPSDSCPQNTTGSTVDNSVQFFNPANEPKLFSVTDFVCDKNPLGNIKNIPQDDKSLSNTLPTISGNKYRMSSNNKRLKYYSGPISGNIVPDCNAVLHSNTSSPLNSDHHLNQSNLIESETTATQSNTNNFGLNLSKIQNVVTSFFNPYQNSEYKSSDYSTESLFEKKDVKDSYRLTESLEPIFFSSNNKCTDTLAIPLVENQDPVLKSFQNSDSLNNEISSTCSNFLPLNFTEAPDFFNVTTNQSFEPIFFSNVSNQVQENNFDFSSNIPIDNKVTSSHYTFPEANSILPSAPPSYILENSNVDAFQSQSFVTDFFDNSATTQKLGDDFLLNPVDENASLCDTFSEINPFPYSVLSHEENDMKTQNSSSQEITTDKETSHGFLVSPNEPLLLENISNTKIEESKFSQDIKSFSSNSEETSTSMNFEKLAIKFDNINIAANQNSNIHLDDFVIEPNDSTLDDIEESKLVHSDLNSFASDFSHERKNNSINHSGDLFSKQNHEHCLSSKSNPTDSFFGIPYCDSKSELKKIIDEPQLSSTTHLSGSFIFDNAENLPDQNESAIFSSYDCNETDKKSFQNLLIRSTENQIIPSSEEANIFSDFGSIEKEISDKQLLNIYSKNQAIECSLNQSHQPCDPEDETVRADNEIKEIFSKSVLNEYIEKIDKSVHHDTSEEFNSNNIFFCNTGNEHEKKFAASFPSKIYEDDYSMQNINSLSEDISNDNCSAPVLEVGNYVSTNASLFDANLEKSVSAFDSSETFDFNLNTHPVTNVLTSYSELIPEPNSNSFTEKSTDSNLSTDKSNSHSAIFSNENFNNGFYNSNNLLESFSPSIASSKTDTTKPNESKEDKESIPLFNYFSLMQPSASNDLNL